MLYFDHQTCFIYQKHFVKISSEIRENEHALLLFWCMRNISEKIRNQPKGNGEGNITTCSDANWRRVGGMNCLWNQRQGWWGVMNTPYPHTTFHIY